MDRLFEEKRNTADPHRRAGDRDHTKRSRVVMYMLVIMGLILASSVGTLGMLLWDQAAKNNRQAAEAKESEVTRCMIVYALGVQEKGDYRFCDEYKKWIKENTNIKVP